MASSDNTIINVSGECTIYKPAERCQVAIRISHESETQNETVSRVTSLTNDLSSHLKTLSPPSGMSEHDDHDVQTPITWYSMSRLNSRSWIPYRPNARPGDEVPKRRYSTTTHFNVKFRDFKKLSEVVGDLAKQQDVHVDHLAWSLTNKTRDSLQTQVRQGAYKDAFQKATDYARVCVPQSTAARKLKVTEINDGHSSTQHRTAFMAKSARAPGAAMARSTMSFGGGNGGEENSQDDEVINFEPEEVGVSANVSCTFEITIPSVSE